MPLQNHRRRIQNSLWLKLMGIFTIIIVTGFSVTFFVIESATATQFRRFVLAGDVIQAQNLVSVFAEYYLHEGGWENIDALIQGQIVAQPPFQDDSKRSTPDEGARKYSLIRTVAALNRIAIADGAGIVIFDTTGLLTGQQHPKEHLSKGVSIKLNDSQIGTIMVGSMIDPVLNPLDHDFLHSVRLAVVLSEVAIVLVALVLGSIFFFHITSPVRELTRGVEGIAAGNFDRRIAVSRNDEIGRLGNAYNSMAESLGQAVQVRRQMLADIAHELRTPLTLIQGNLEAFIDGMYELNLENIAGIYDETLVLTRLLDDLRDLAVAEAGQLRLDIDSVNVVSLAETTIERFKIYAIEKEVIITLEIPSDSPSVLGDFQRLNQAIGNLIANALAHSHRGGRVKVKVETTKRSSQNVLPFVRIAIYDDGPGIGKENLRRIFNRFYRTDKSRNRRNGGSGLGLPIADKIIEAHGGMIRVDSELGEGSIFSILLPMQQS